MLDKANESKRKLASQALFHSMLKSKHIVVPPKKVRGTRAENKRKGINDSL